MVLLGTTTSSDVETTTEVPWWRDSNFVETDIFGGFGKREQGRFGKRDAGQIPAGTCELIKIFICMGLKGSICKKI